MRSVLPIAIRIWAWAAVLRILKRMVPLETLVRLMQCRPGRSRAGSRAVRSIESYLDMTGRFPLRPPSNCLERSLIVYRMLCEAAAAPELVVGFRHAGDGRLHGHVWVTVDGRPLAEGPQSLAAYTPLVRFDARGQRLVPPDGRNRGSGAAASGALPRGLAFD